MTNTQARTALVTGSGRNIGRAIVLELARRGCQVVVNGARDEGAARAVAAQASALGASAHVVMADVGDAAGARALCEQAIAHFGAVDILVNNAAIRPATPFLEMSPAEWQRVLDVDLNAAFHTAQICLPGMVERGFGRIINFAGMNAIDGYAGRAHVSAAKHAVWGLTKALAREFGPAGVTVNTLSPGPIAGQRDDPAMAQHIESQRGRIPLGRLGTAEEIAALAAFLASDEGGFVSGQLIAANGAART